MKINWTEKAEERLDEIYAYYSLKSKKVSMKIVREIKSAVDPLAGFPQMAAIDPLLSDLPKSFRSLIVRRIYKIVYYIDDIGEKINIVTVWDCRQDDKKLRKEVM
jgi:plasmid stabilization system protein ParE